MTPRSKVQLYRRFLGWADSRARGLEIPADAEVADSTHELALVPGRWTE